MKTAVLALAAISLVELVSAQPHRRHVAHKAAHVKRDVVTVVTTLYGEATAAAEVVVYVNPEGAPVSTATKFLEDEAVATAPPAAPPTVSTISSVVPVVTSSIAPSATPASSSVAAASSSAAPVAVGNGYGVTYNPYNGDGSCKSASQVLTDFNAFDEPYAFARTYGVDCNTIPNVLAACKAKGMKLFAGIFSLASVTSDIETIISAVGGDWSSILLVSVGNELVNSGAADAGSVVAAIGTARGLLRAAGFTGPVGTVDTLVATRANPSLCDSSDVCTVNCHPFFDGNTAASDSGGFLTSQIQTLKAVLANPNQEIVISETGWPSQGNTNGAAVPSPSNQAAAISSIKAAFQSNPAGVTLFNPYNMMWKASSPAQFDAEPYWGFLGNSPSG